MENQIAEKHSSNHFDMATQIDPADRNTQEVSLLRINNRNFATPCPATSNQHYRPLSCNFLKNKDKNEY